VTTGQPLQGATFILVSAPHHDVHTRVFVPGGKRNRNVAAILSEVADGLAAVGGPREDGRHRKVALYSAISGVRGQFVLRAAPGVYEVVGDMAGYAQSTSEPLMTHAEASAHVRMMLSPPVSFGALRFCLLWGARWWHPTAPAARMALTLRAPTGCIIARAGVVEEAAESGQAGALAAVMCAAAHRGVRGEVDVAMNRGGPLTITLDRTAAEIYTIEVELREELEADVAAMAVRRCAEALDGTEAELRVYTYDGGERRFRVERDGEVRAGGRCVWIAAQVDGAEAHLLPVNRVDRPAAAPVPALGAAADTLSDQSVAASDADGAAASGDAAPSGDGSNVMEQGSVEQDGGNVGVIDGGAVRLAPAPAAGLQAGGSADGEAAADAQDEHGGAQMRPAAGTRAITTLARDESSEARAGEARGEAEGRARGGVRGRADARGRREEERARAEERMRRRDDERRRRAGRPEGAGRREDDGAGGGRVDDGGEGEVPETVTVTTTDLATGKVTTRTETLAAGGPDAGREERDRVADAGQGSEWDGGHRWVGRREGATDGGDDDDAADGDSRADADLQDPDEAAQRGDDSEDAATAAAKAAADYAPQNWCQFQGGSGAVREGARGDGVEGRRER
jgi:hypothetical protein